MIKEQQHLIKINNQQQFAYYNDFWVHPGNNRLQYHFSVQSLALAHCDVDDGKVVFVPWVETDFRTGDAPWWS